MLDTSWLTVGVCLVDRSSGVVIESNPAFRSILRDAAPAFGIDTQIITATSDVLELLGLAEDDLPDASSSALLEPTTKSIFLTQGRKMQIQSKLVDRNDSDKILLEVSIERIAANNALSRLASSTSSIDLCSGGPARDMRLIQTLHDDNFHVDFDDLVILNRIGKGAFGDIYKCKHRGTIVAAKKIKKDQSLSQGDRSRSAKQQSSISGTSIGTLEEAFEDSSYHSGRRMSSSSMTELGDIVDDELDDMRDGKRLSLITSGDDDSTRSTALSDFLREVHILKTLRHPNIILFLAYSATPHKEVALYELMKCSLLDVLLVHVRKKTRMKQKLQIKYSIDLCLGMQYLHSCKPVVLHRDLKPSNLLISTSGTLKICDFGLSKLLPEKGKEQSRADYNMTGETGTYRFMAPEVYRREHWYDEKVDVYSFGMIFYNILSGHAPWPTVPGLLAAKWCASGQRPDIKPSWDYCLKFLLSECWDDVAAARPSFELILETLTSYQSAASLIKKNGMVSNSKRLIRGASFVGGARQSSVRNSSVAPNGEEEVAQITKNKQCVIS